MSRHIFQSVYVDQNGNAVQDGNITVYLANSDTLATIYSVVSGGSAVSGSVVTSNNSGHYLFFVDDADYNLDQKFKIILSKDAFVSITYDNVEIFGYEGTFSAEHTVSDGSHSAGIIDQAEMDLTSAAAATGKAVRQDEFSAEHTDSDGTHQNITTNKVSADSASGLQLFDDGGNGPIINDGGFKTNTSQPCFLSLKADASNDQTGDGTEYVVGFGDDIFDQNSDLSHGAGITTFTAPITGKYSFAICVSMTGLLAAHTSGLLTIKKIGTPNVTYPLDATGWGLVASATRQYIAKGSITIPLDITDTVTIAVTVSNDTKVIDFSAGNFTSFSGYLVC